MSSENVDMLSRLPEEIVSHILSLMPTKHAVRTSILSKRWRYSWMFVTNLYFTENIRHSHGLDSFSEFVDQVLKFCKSPQLNLFRMHLVTLCWLQRPSVSKWIDKAIRLNVHELDIQVNVLELPLSFFTCKTLTKLRLDHIAYDHDVWESVHLPCLKTLDIAIYTNPLVNAFKLVRGCPILESLSLEVQCCKDEEDYLFDVPTLKRLKLTLYCSQSFNNKVVLIVPNLEYLFVGGNLCSLFVMEDVSSLVEATVSFTNLSIGYLWVELLNGLYRVKSLSAQADGFPYLGNTFCSPLPTFPNMKHLELKGFCQSGLISKFLESSPELKHLCIEKVYELLLQEPGYTSWIEPKLVPPCMLTNLTTIKFSNCKGHKCDIQFLEYVLGNAEVLKKVTIIWESMSSELQLPLCTQLLKVSRASQDCEICFHARPLTLIS
ncbi:putative F-box domain, FBD domain, leucine-rich repeat domain superfamily [Helianthus annuus]|nr:F-box/LRR-repeat protein At4g14103 isoform X1 [Helianthus annuus]KAJ0449001.1 putative F-box domain, FBD domain, leucine-rich repeat domain superfamily [Helianthus annuus]KAJ0828079.1 putative F-box domain, FBD domain, leucine-rich repeat domain superfamily [Helianthus annuus]